MKRFTAIAAAAVLGAANLAAGQYPPSASAPAGYGSTAQPSQSQPTPGYAVPRPSPRVQVFPFEAVANPSGLDWVGRGLQQSLQTDVSHTGATLVIAGAPLPPNTTALEAAKASYANLAVTGTYQVQGDQVRADGQLIDVATGHQVGGFSARAPLNSIFQLEDAMGGQLQRLLPLDRPTTDAGPTVGSFDDRAAGGSQAVTVVDNPTPSYVDQAPVNVYYDQPASAYSYPDSFYGDYGYGYPYYDYYSPFAIGFYGGIGYYGGGYRHYGYGRGYGGYGYGHGYGHGYGGLHANPTFSNSGYRGGFSINISGGRSYGGLSRVGGVSSFHTGGGESGGGFHGGGGFGGGGHGGGGGHR